MGEQAISTDPVPDAAVDRSDAGSKLPPSTVYLWAMLLAKIYEVFPLISPQCGGELRIIAFLTEPDPIVRILDHLGEPTTPPRIAPARAPPDRGNADLDQTPLLESEHAEPVSEFEYDQTVTG